MPELVFFFNFIFYRNAVNQLVKFSSLHVSGNHCPVLCSLEVDCRLQLKFHMCTRENKKIKNKKGKVNA